MKILNLAYLEVFKIFRRNLMPNKELSPDLKRKIEGTNILDTKCFKDAEIFLEEVKKKQKGDTIEDIEKYMENIKELIIGFEDWFENKKGRNRKKNK